MNKKRVVITGIGAVSPLGHNIVETFDNLCAGKNAIFELPEFKEAGFPVYIGARVQNIEKLYKRFPEAERYGSRKLAYALSAMDEALAMSGIADLSKEECGLYFGVETSRIAFKSAFEIFKRSAGEDMLVDNRLFGEKCLDMLQRDDIINKFPFFIPKYIASKFNISGPLLATSNACASSNFAIGEAYRKLSEGRVEIAITGSADEMIDEYIVTGFSILGALSESNETPETASRPFDKNRNGFVIGEAGAVLIMETLEHALARNANIICEVGGFGTSSDGEKITACHPQGSGLAKAMTRAISDAGLKPEEMVYINAHATSTRLNDASETRAIKTVFGEHAKKLLINSTKSMIGHTVAAAGAIEAAVTARSISEGRCHPTKNLTEPDAACDLFYCPDGFVEADIKAAMSNSCGFSGGNSCVVFKKY